MRYDFRNVTPRQIDEEWEAALNDAGFSSEQCVLLFSDVPRETSRVAQWCEPGMAISPTPNDDLLTEELAADANSGETVRRHRIIARRPSAETALSIARFAGTLRHELEHARQWQACGPPVAKLSEIADRVLLQKLKDLPGGSVFTNLKPNEQDANAASAIFLRARWPKAIPELLQDRDDAPLARSLTPPGSLETLVKRMIAFLYLFEDLCQALKEREEWSFGFDDWLEEVAPGSRQLWQTLSTTSLPRYWRRPPRVP